MPKARPLLTTTDEILAQLNFIRNKKQEYFVCLSLDSAQRLIARRTVFIGTLTSMLVHPREVFADPLKDRAESVIIAHNHPSGESAPSREDIRTTQQLVSAGQILGIPLLDHIVVASERHYSFVAHGLIFPELI
jgi:DNA repair protein RadC